MMESKNMESSVPCPECGQLIPVVMEPYSAVMAEMMKGFGIGKTRSFQGMGKCACGKAVLTSINVSIVGGAEE